MMMKRGGAQASPRGGVERPRGPALAVCRQHAARDAEQTRLGAMAATVFPRVPKGTNEGSTWQGLKPQR